MNSIRGIWNLHIFTITKHFRLSLAVLIFPKFSLVLCYSLNYTEAELWLTQMITFNWNKLHVIMTESTNMYFSVSCILLLDMFLLLWPTKCPGNSSDVFLWNKTHVSVKDRGEGKLSPMLWKIKNYSTLICGLWTCHCVKS